MVPKAVKSAALEAARSSTQSHQRLGAEWAGLALGAPSCPGPPGAEVTEVAQLPGWSTAKGLLDHAVEPRPHEWLLPELAPFQFALVQCGWVRPLVHLSGDQLPKRRVVGIVA